MSRKADGQNELESEWFTDNYIHNNHLPLKRAVVKVGQAVQFTAEVAVLVCRDYPCRFFANDDPA